MALGIRVRKHPGLAQPVTPSPAKTHKKCPESAHRPSGQQLNFNQKLIFAGSKTVSGQGGIVHCGYQVLGSVRC